MLWGIGSKPCTVMNENEIAKLETDHSEYHDIVLLHDEPMTILEILSYITKP